MKNKFFVTIIAAIALLASGCNGATANKVVPTYQGMTISKTTRGMRVNNHKNLGDEQEGQDEVPPEDDEHQEETGEEGKDIENIVTIEVEGDEETKYYVKPNEKFIIEVHVSNPSDFEIQSFTLNGNKYANYMFKDGSTMELLLLETTAPSKPGYVEYTIDAIKYIDGTEIKDVRMDGDKTIKAGVAYANGPTATIKSQVVNPTSIDLSINVKDTNSLIGNNELAVYLTDGENVVTSKPLVVGDNDVLFDNLIMSRNYEYGVVAAFDMVDGKGLHSEWLVKDEFKTLGAFSIDSVTLDKTSIEFEISKNGDNGEINSISLYDAVTDKLVAHGNKDTRRFDNLLSDHEYNLYVDFKYQLGEEVIHDFASRKNAKTEAKVVPTIEVKNDVVTDLTIKADYEVTDPDSIGVINSVELYKGNTLVNTNVDKDIDFDNLDSFSEYKVVINYSYDLNDGNGMQNAKVEKEYKTSPHLEFVSCRIINTSAVSEGDTIYMQATLVNPTGATPSSAVVNGETYPCSGSTSPTKIYLEILNNGQFAGGMTELVVEKVIMEIEGKEYGVVPQDNNKDSIFINGTITLKSVEWINDKGEVISYCFKGDKISILFTFENKTGYIIDNLGYADSNIENNLIKIDDEHYKLDFTAPNYGRTGGYYFNSFTYHNEYLNKTASISVMYPGQMFTLDGIKEISTVDDLMWIKNNPYQRYYFKMMNDIDLRGIEWTSLGDLYSGAVFDGNNHKLTNMSNVSTYQNSVPKLGLFNEVFSSTIKNLTIEDITIIVTVNNPSRSITYGALCTEKTGDSLFENCHVSGDISINCNNVEAGGLIGFMSSNNIIRNCSVNVNITCKNGNEKTGKACGLVGRNDFSGSGTYEISNCDIKGALSGEQAYPVLQNIEEHIANPSYNTTILNIVYDVNVNGVNNKGTYNKQN